MEEIQRVIIRGFSGATEYYEDNLEITRSGKCNYFGKFHDGLRAWSSNSTSEGFQLQFSTMCIEIMEASKVQNMTSISYGGYEIDLYCSLEEHYKYTFYGTMADNFHEALRDVLIDFFPLYEELPMYLDSFKEELLTEDMDCENIIN